ncbi:MAG TPA: hypothetical protein EYP04_12120, partial [Anaerolineae bacterium]|nr:hypothetical protein [Anaerolineae bacterium]
MKRLTALLLVLVIVLSACAPATPVVVTKEVEKPVEVTKIVEKVVTPTPVPKPAVYKAAGGWTKPPAYHGSRFAPGGVGAAWWYVFEPLFYYVPATGETIMALAESIDEGKDAFTVTLRKGVKWHDGEPFTSKDVWTTFQLRY